jgi:ubiquinone/menaquinone biosynthesis C-methylase UbiE
MNTALDGGTRSATRSPADIYDELFVPALFAHWGPVLCDAAGVVPGQRILDVGCGTGAATLAAAQRVGPGGSVVGLDANPEMLAVARRKPGGVQWRDGKAESLPFDDASFDAVISQFAMMFFDDAVAALREMRRVLRAEGRMAVAVCDAVEHSPGYAALAALLDRLFGRQIGDAFRAPFALGDATRLQGLCDEAGLTAATVTQHDAPVRFESVDALVSSERACVWTLGGLLDDDQFSRLREAANIELGRFADRRGRIEFSMPALLIGYGMLSAP